MKAMGGALVRRGGVRFAASAWLLLAIPTAGHAQAAPEPAVTLYAVGDVMLCRGVGRVIRKRGADYPFASLRAVLRAPDILFGNLEGPITPGRPVPSGRMVFRDDPGVETALHDAGFTIFSLANNHIPDFGAKGIADTLAALRKVGIAGVGAGMDADEATRPVVIERHGLRFAFLAYNDPSMVPRRYAAGPNHPGTNLVDVKRVAREVAVARAEADFVIVSMHHGWEYRRASPWQRAFAHAAIDAGADLVIGHHPHVVQAVEKYKGKYIAYSLGNFVFDQTFSDNVKEGVILEARFTKKGLVALRFVPVRIWHGAQPRLATDRSVIRHVFRRLEIPIAADGTVFGETPPSPGAGVR